MSDSRLKIDLVKLIRQAIGQLVDTESKELLTRWLEQPHEPPPIIEVDPNSVRPEPGVEPFCPRCGYETVELHGHQAFCRTCGLRWNTGA